MSKSTIIPPTIGRVVHFFLGPMSADTGFARHPFSASDGPYAALIAHVWSDTLVNLTVFDANGVQHSRTSVALVQDGDPVPSGFYCTWMPFQRGQAAKTEQALGAAQELGMVIKEMAETMLQKSQPESLGAAGRAVPIVPNETLMSFGIALDLLKHGERVARLGWNGKGMFVYLVPPASCLAQTGAAKAHFGEGALIPYAAYFAIKNVNETVSTWVPSINDCLAEDWVLVKE